MIIKGKKKIRVQVTNLETNKSKSFTIYGMTFEKAFSSIKNIFK